MLRKDQLGINNKRALDARFVRRRSLELESEYKSVGAATAFDGAPVHGKSQDRGQCSWAPRNPWACQLLLILLVPCRETHHVGQANSLYVSQIHNSQIPCSSLKVLALPLHTHSTLRTRVANFQNGLLAANPPITGIDRSIVIDPRRLHLTLGVMALSTDGPHTVASALSLLQSLQPAIAVLLQGRNSVKVRLDSLDILKPDRNRSNAHVLFLGPSTLDDDDGVRLQAVCSAYSA